MYHAKATGCSTYELCAIVVLMRIHNDCILVCHNNFTFSFIMESMQTRSTVRSIKLLQAEVQCSNPDSCIVRSRDEWISYSDSIVRKISTLNYNSSRYVQVLISQCTCIT